MLIKVHAMHVMLCVGPVSGPAVQHMYVCTVQCTAQHSTTVYSSAYLANRKILLRRLNPGPHLPN